VRDSTIRITIDCNELASEFADTLKREDAVEFVMLLDKRFGEVEFTEAIIKGLFESLRGDLTPEEIKTLLAELERAK
jgi:hypothetical protein